MTVIDLQVSTGNAGLKAGLRRVEAKEEDNPTFQARAGLLQGCSLP